MYSPVLASCVCVIAIVSRTVLAVGDGESAIPLTALFSAPLSVETLERWGSEAKAVIQGGPELHSIESLHYAAEMMSMLEAIDDRYHQDFPWRTLAKDFIGTVEVNSLEEAYHATSLRSALKYGGNGKKIKGSKHLMEDLRSSSTSVKEMLHALVAAEGIQNVDVDVNGLCTRVASSVEKVGYDDPINAALFLSKVQVILQSKKENPGEDQVQQFSACENLLASTLKTLKGSSSVSDGSNHPFFAPIVLSAMEKKDRPKLSAERVHLITSQLSGATLARGDSVQAVSVLTGLNFLTSIQPPPVVVSIRPNAATPSNIKDGKVSVVVTDLYGKSLQGLTEVKIDNKKLKRNPDGGTYTLSLGENDLLEPGNKVVNFFLKSHSSFGDDRLYTVKQNFHIPTQASVVNLSTEKIIKGTNYPVSGTVASGKNGDKLVISAKVKDHSSKLGTPLCQFDLQHVESGDHVYFNGKAKLDGDSMWECKMQIKLDKEAEKFEHRSGYHELCVKLQNGFVVADDKESSACDKVFLDFPDVPASKPVGIYSVPLLHESDTSFHALPEVHCPPSPPPPSCLSIVTLFACGLITATLLAFFYIPLSVGSNGSTQLCFVRAAVLQVCIGGALLCTSMWWFSVNFPVVRYLLALVSVMLICANKLTKSSTK